jgi:hypothetical protein
VAEAVIERLKAIVPLEARNQHNLDVRLMEARLYLKRQETTVAKQIMKQMLVDLGQVFILFFLEDYHIFDALCCSL